MAVITMHRPRMLSLCVCARDVILPLQPAARRSTQPRRRCCGGAPEEEVLRRRSAAAAHLPLPLPDAARRALLHRC